MISAEIIADSLNPNGARLTTFILVFPRIVLAEFNTHRMVSKNSASSRAIPFHKMLGLVQDTPFIPMRFMKEHKGMQGTEYFDEAESKRLEIRWLKARDHAVESAVELNDMGLTKQLCNRILEPFLYHTVIATASDWENFFALRAHDAAEIHIADLAFKMLSQYNQSTPKQLKVGEWHIPFGEKFEIPRIQRTLLAQAPEGETALVTGEMVERAKVKIATARCARVSYLNFDGKDDYVADLKLHDTLSTQGHWSPFEHCAQAAHGESYSGNFKGFVQYRKFFHNENKNDFRVRRQSDFR